MMTIRRAALAILLCLILSLPATAEIYRVVGVHDGDGTFTVDPPRGGDRKKVRLHGVDTPELGQPYGQAAKAFSINFLKSLAKNFSFYFTYWEKYLNMW